MPEYQVIRRVRLGAGHAPTGRTVHRRGEAEIPVPAELRIIQAAGESGCYLVHLDAAGAELTDTFHDTLEDALAQAEWEFQVRPGEWRGPGD